MNALEPPPHLQDLEIGGYMGNIIYPNWMMSCTTLKRLQLLRCVKLEHLPSLGQLPFLEVLKISWLLNVKKVGDEFLGIEDSKNKKDYDIVFPNLKSLEFWDLYNWEEWIGMGETGEEEEKDNGIVTNPILIKIMPRLQSLKIFRCYGLKSLPDYLKNSGIELEERYQKGSRESWHFPNIILIRSNDMSSY